MTFLVDAVEEVHNDSLDNQVLDARLEGLMMGILEHIVVPVLFRAKLGHEAVVEALLYAMVSTDSIMEC